MVCTKFCYSTRSNAYRYTYQKQVYPIDCGYDQDERALLNQGWKKLFEEQFENELDNWQIWNGGAYNRELQLYQSANLNIKDGILSIEDRKETHQYLTNYFEAKLDDQFSKDHTSMISAAENLSDCNHVYEMEWTIESLISYFDDRLVDTKKNDPHIASLFGKHQQLVLNLAIGGGFYPSLDIAKIQTGTMLIDWVKVYASK
jgi:hypothetical protein